MVRHRVLVVLCVTEVVSWGVLYYAFAVLAPTISADTGWSAAAVTGAFSAGLVVSALVGVPAGRWLDRLGPRPVMTAGSLIAVPAVTGVALAPGYGWFLASWLLAGVAMAGVLYPPAFAALTRWWGTRRVTALTALTLAGGLSSTVFGPLTAALLDGADWRRTYLVLAVLLAVTIPAHALGLRGPWPADGGDPGAAGPTTPQAARAVARSREFAQLTAAMTLGMFAAYAVLVNQVPLLLERGLSTETAAWALGLGGAGQVAGRLLYGPIVRWTSVRGRSVGLIGACAVTIGVLGAVPGPAALLVVLAVLAGAARGLFTLLQATAVSDRWGSVHYGRLNGLLSAPMLAAAAVAPFAGAALAGLLGSYAAVFGVLAAAAAVGAVLVPATGAARRVAAR